MSDAISQSKPHGRTAERLTVHGIGAVHYAADIDGETRLRHLYQSDPVRILFPTPARNEIPSAVFVTTSGGLVGGDVLELSAQTFAGVAVQFTSQAAEKIYRAAAYDSKIQISLTAEPNSWLEWLPQETILFDGARLQRQTTLHAAAGARILAGEMTVLGRSAMGEALRCGRLYDAWSVYRAGRLCWADRFLLEEDIAAHIAHPAGLNQATAFATIVYVADDAAAYLTAARELVELARGERRDSVRIGTTVLNGLLLVRFLAQDAYDLHGAFGKLWAGMRQELGQLPAELPRLWHI